MACNTNLQSASSLEDNSISLMESSLQLPIVADISYHSHIGFLNINSLRNKIIELRVLMERYLPDVLVIEETKPNSASRQERTWLG